MSAAAPNPALSLPQDLEAERSVLGGILATNGLSLDDVADVLKPEHFHRNAHQRIFAAMLEISSRSEPIDFLMVARELKKAGALDLVGGPAYIAGLTDGVPRSTNVVHYARLVKATHARREVIYLSNKLQAAAYEAELEAPALVDLAERGLLAISADAVPGDLVPASEIVRKMFPVLEEISAHGRPVTGLHTGFHELDLLTRGLQRGNLIILGGRPSMGKSTFAGQLALQVARTHRVAFFSVEMAELEHGFRSVSMLGQVDGQLLQSGRLPMHHHQHVAEALNNLAGLQLWVDDSGTLSPLQMRSKARRMKARHGLDLIVVDYLQLLQHPKAESREQAIATTARMLKQTARELDVPILALSQLSRKVDERRDNRPQLSDLRESGSLEQDSDVVLLIYRPPADPGAHEVPPTELIVAKQRNGPTTEIKFRWVREQFRFEEIPS